MDDAPAPSSNDDDSNEKLLRKCSGSRGKSQNLVKVEQETGRKVERALEGANDNLQNKISYKGIIMHHFIRVCTVCYDKTDLQRK